ncbi:DUF92 domain-containing protein [Oscillochloris sp. ZM17-4]|uniref:DUF92 domain-containing protein n=1 Tax=Oscillochloris sp. ZM17-4 TaxID=2866714 RepID=UPI001C73C086|nr:DUF92 domain-containing protein [Oscillochloris sp. ZM17-4]MBX0329338.1 DUF92 domain-containing protein [Oscillochloris sp. ZM17-4]
MIDLALIGFGLVLSTAIGGLAHWRKSLTVSGWVGAVLVGTLTLGFGGWSWGLTLIIFFITSSLLSRYKEQIKERRAAEKFSKGGQRDFVQTMANGGLAALCAVAYALAGRPPELLAAFAGIMATVNADTWATELGVLSPHRPRLITSGRPVEPGTSGGITLFGSSAAALGAALIGVVLLVLLAVEGSPAPWWLIPAAILGGFGGAMLDSLLGATVQAIYAYSDGRETERRFDRSGNPTAFVRGLPWLNNDVVNSSSSIGGALIAILVMRILGG